MSAHDVTPTLPKVFFRGDSGLSGIGWPSAAAAQGVLIGHRNALRAVREPAFLGNDVPFKGFERLQEFVVILFFALGQVTVVFPCRS